MEAIMIVRAIKAATVLAMRPMAASGTDGDWDAVGGMEVPVAMGSGEVFNFQPTGGGKVAITGDLVLIAKEVNPVLRVLRENDIQVTVLHNRMLDDKPRLFFMHFWANDDQQARCGTRQVT
jgi:hypothetical protein